MFFGSMAAVSLFNSDIPQGRIRCLYHYDAERVNTCSEIRNGGNGWSGSFMQNAVPVGTVLHGSAYLDGDFGLQLQGEGDYAEVKTVGTFARGTFTVAFWFGRGEECDGSEDFQFLFSTSQRPTSRPWSSDISGVHIYLACDDDGQVSTINGDVVRVWLVDKAGGRAQVDYSLQAVRDGGSVTDQWVHIALTVTNDAIAFYIDGNLAPQAALGYSIAEASGGGLQPVSFDADSVNSALPDPSNLSPPLTGFNVEERYEDHNTYNTTINMDAGVHMFHGHDTMRDGWHGGFWTIWRLDTGEYLAGGREQGQITSMNSNTNFTVPDPEYTVNAFGPDCGARYNDFSTNMADTPITLAAGTYDMHTGEGDWGKTYWTVREAVSGGVAADSGRIIAGGKGYGCCGGEDNQNLTKFTLTQETEVRIIIKTDRRSGVRWVLNHEDAPFEDWHWDQCRTPLMIEIDTQRYADEISWSLDSESDRRRDWRKRMSGPDGGTVNLGVRSDVVYSANNPSRWTYFIGTMADVNLYAYQLEADQVKQLYRTRVLLSAQCVVGTITLLNNTTDIFRLLYRSTVSSERVRRSSARALRLRIWPEPTCTIRSWTVCCPMTRASSATRSWTGPLALRSTVKETWSRWAQTTTRPVGLSRSRTGS
jgi:hypothetical protein